MRLISVLLFSLLFVGSCLAAPSIYVINDSLLPDATIRTMVSAVQIQINRDLAPIYNVRGKLIIPSKGFKIPLNAWTVTFKEFDSRPYGGLHEVKNGIPRASVFVGNCQIGELPVSMVLSHEVLEMLVNPYANKAVLITEKGESPVKAYLYEIGNPVQNKGCSYKINGIVVSDFVYPSWFRTDGFGKFSHNKCIYAPFQVAYGGYVHVFYLLKKNNTISWVHEFP